MKIAIKSLTVLALAAVSLYAQAATRIVVLTWVPSPSPGITGTLIQSAPASTGPWTDLACVGTVAGLSTLSCVPGSTASTSTYTDTQPVGGVVWYQLIATGPPCTLTTTTACGATKPSVAVSTTIPPQPESITTVVVSVK